MGGKTASPASLDTKRQVPQVKLLSKLSNAFNRPPDQVSDRTDSPASRIRRPVSTATPGELDLLTSDDAVEARPGMVAATAFPGAVIVEESPSENDERDPLRYKPFPPSSPSTLTFIDSFSSDLASGLQPLTLEPDTDSDEGVQLQHLLAAVPMQNSGDATGSGTFVEKESIWKQATSAVRVIKRFIINMIAQAIKKLIRIMLNIGLCACYCAGLGRQSKSCLTIRELLWLRINAVIMKQWTQREPPPSSNRWRLRPCEILHQQGEPLLIWDAFQELLFLISRGAFIAERQAAVTEDGHLLILHRLQAVPQYIRDKLFTLEDVTLINALFFALQTVWTRLWSRNNVPNAVSAPDSVESSGDAVEWQILMFQHGLLESSLNWIMACTIDYDSPDITAAGGDRFLFGSNRAFQYYSMLPSQIGRIATLFRLLAWQRVVAPLWNSVLKPVLRELTSLCVGISRMLQGRCPVSCRGEKLIDRRRLRNSLPLRLMLDEVHTRGGRLLKFDIWLTNTRGNAFSDPVFLESALRRAPMGYREVSFDEMAKTNAIQHQAWTHHDMSVLDIEATFAKIYSVHRKERRQKSIKRPCMSNPVLDGKDSAALEPIVIAFSQGAAMFLLNTAFRRLVRKRKLAPMDIAPVRLKGMVLLSPPIILKRNGESVPNNWVTEEDRQIKKTNAFADTTDNAWDARQLEHGCIEENYCCWRTPLSLSVSENIIERRGNGRRLWTLADLEEKDRLANQLRGWKRLMKGDLSFTKVFFVLVWRYMKILTMIVESLVALIPSGCMAYGELFVRRGLRFHLGKLRTEYAKWVYKFTPNGTTSPSNLKLWQKRMENGEPLGYGFLQSISCSQVHNRESIGHGSDLRDELASQLPDFLPVMQFSAESCPLHIVLGFDDPITDTAKSVRLIASQCPYAEVEYAPKDKSIRTSDGQVGNVPTAFKCICREQHNKGPNNALSGATAQEKVTVKIMEGTSHLDVTWSEAALTNIQQDILKHITAWSDR